MKHTTNAVGAIHFKTGKVKQAKKFSTPEKSDSSVRVQEESKTFDTCEEGQPVNSIGDFFGLLGREK